MRTPGPRALAIFASLREQLDATWLNEHKSLVLDAIVNAVPRSGLVAHIEAKPPDMPWRFYQDIGQTGALDTEIDYYPDSNGWRYRIAAHIAKGRDDYDDEPLFYVKYDARGDKMRSLQRARNQAAVYGDVGALVEAEKRLARFK